MLLDIFCHAFDDAALHTQNAVAALMLTPDVEYATLFDGAPRH